MTTERNEAAMRLRVDWSKWVADDQYGAFMFDLEDALAFERRATVERIRAALDMPRQHGYHDRSLADVRAILDEALATPSDKATR